MFTDIISWLPSEVAKCVIFLLKINTGRAAIQVTVRKPAFQSSTFRELRERTTVCRGRERRGTQTGPLFLGDVTARGLGTGKPHRKQN